MKRNIIVGVVCALLVLSLAACENENPSGPSVVVSKGNTDNYWAQQMSKLKSMEAEQARTSTTATTAKETTTTERSWFTAKTSRSTLPSRSASTTKWSTTTIPKQTAVTLSQEMKDRLYEMVYQQNMLDYNSRLREQQAQKSRVTQIKNKIANLRNQASNLHVQYQTDLRQLSIKCEAMGMSTNSGYYTGQAKSLESQYKANLAPISKEIDELEEELEEAEAAVGAPVEEPSEAEIYAEYLVELEAYQKKLQSY